MPGPRREEHRLTSTGGFNRRGGQRATQDSPINVDRRKFLAGVAVAGAATAVTPQKTPIAAPTPHRRPSGLRPSAQRAAAETATPKELPRAHAADGSDFMVDVIKTLDFEYLNICRRTQRRASAGCTAQRGRSSPPNLSRSTRCRALRTTNRAMPPCREEVLSDADLADLYAYLQSIPKGPDPKTIPLLNR